MITSSFRSIIVYPPSISDQDVSIAVGLLANGMMLDEGLPPEKHTNIVRESDIKLGQIPQSKKIIKMGKKEHINNFFADGSLFIGNVLFYGAFDHGEIGDQDEITCTVISRSPHDTVISEVSTGLNNHVFCCYSGDPDEKCISDFGYDGHFEIVDAEGFAKAISNCLGSENYTYAECAYAIYKNIMTYTNKEFENIISPDTPILNACRTARNFIKPDRYSKQNEFRFIWDADCDLRSPKLIKCPQAIQFCRR